MMKKYKCKSELSFIINFEKVSKTCLVKIKWFIFCTLDKQIKFNKSKLFIINSESSEL